MVHACVPNTTTEPENTATKKPSNKEISTKTPQSTPTNSYYALGTVTVNLGNLRQGPGTDYLIIGYSEKGEMHEIYGINPEQTWLLVDENQPIWIALSLVSLDTDISNIPIINNLPSPDSPEITETPNTPMKNTPTKSVEDPEPTEFAGCPYGCTYHPPGCNIKGNISFTTKEKIYHVPGGEFYNETVISPEDGERWFCTEAEALSNGWRKSYQ